MAVNEEMRDLFAAGADLVQIDEPYLQARPDPAGEYAVEAINRAVEGVAGVTALHTCFGYAPIVHDRPSGYPFLAQLNDGRGVPASRPRPAGLTPSQTRDPGGMSLIGGLLAKLKP